MKMKIEIIRTEIVKPETNNVYERIYKTYIDTDLEFKDQTYFGFDPGTVNLGIAFIYPTKETMEGILYKVDLVRDMDAVRRMMNVRKVLSNLGFFTKWNCPAVIEGASFGNNYRQVELAEQRASIALWCHIRGMKAKIVPPKTIRKQAFGNGNLKNPWDEQIDDDVAAALGCALYSYKTGL